MTFFIPAHAAALYGAPEGFFKGIKVMAIGHSHYCTEGYDQENRCGKMCCNFMIPGKCGNVNANPSRKNSFTRDVMEQYIDYKSGKGKFTNWFNTFTKFARIFSNNEKWADDKLVWESLCLYNFLDVAVKDKDDDGTDAEIADAKTKILSAIEMNSPDVIIVWGEKNGLFNHLRDVFSNLPSNMKWTPKADNNRCGTLSINDKDIKVACIDHPSSRTGNYRDNARSIIASIAPEIIGITPC